MSRSLPLYRPRQSALRYPAVVANRPPSHSDRRDPPLIQQPLHRTPACSSASNPFTHLSRGTQIPIAHAVTSTYPLPRFPPLEVCGRRPPCAPPHLHGASIRKPSQKPTWTRFTFQQLIPDTKVSVSRRYRTQRRRLGMRGVLFRTKQQLYEPRSHLARVEFRQHRQRQNLVAGARRAAKLVPDRGGISGALASGRLQTDTSALLLCFNAAAAENRWAERKKRRVGDILRPSGVIGSDRSHRLNGGGPMPHHSNICYDLLAS